ncbi:MAG: haloacid dehalogenase type II [Caldilineaceae bacterium]|nr:haloacid dehalogenase type II [Caldilineaceae bacterium]
MNFNQFTHLTFDCYGTLIDWERGILAALTPLIEGRGLPVDPAQILRLYAKYEAAEEAGPYKRYGDVLRGVMDGIAAEFGFTPSEDERNALAESVGNWPAFPDSAEALAALKTRHKLVILSNIDDAMFARSNRHLGVEFDEIITAQQVGSYKPSRRNFQVALERLGAQRTQILHVAQSLFHDHVPAKELGFTTVWVNRPSILPGTGVSLPVDVTPDFEVADMASLVREMMGNR